ncbi:MAG TPA: DUF3152 domain-containing protein, partial [Micromonosporaceae bacterium]|nr:DUF3152 domain-containing protein [Micromonosporaceae bacterium]
MPSSPPSDPHPASFAAPYPPEGAARKRPAPYPPEGAARKRPQANHAHLARRGRRRRWRVFVALFLVVLVLVGADLVRRGAGVSLGRQTAAAPTLAAQPAVTAATASPTPTPSPTPARPTASPRPVLTAAGYYPRSGPGTWVYATTLGPVLGTAGTLRRFRVAIESNVAEDMAGFTATLDRTLGDPRSWTGGRTLRLQRVPQGAAAEFTIYLATGETARQVCAAGGVDIRVGGVPYTSCRTAGRVILNLTRWMSSVHEFVGRGVPLEVYRQYLVNHEVGHQLGYNHELCPG